MTLDTIVFPEGEIRNRRLFYGKNRKKIEVFKPYKYIVHLEDLKKVKLNSNYQRIDMYNEVRIKHSLVGEDRLIVKRTQSALRLEDVRGVASFPYDQIKDYLSKIV